MTTQDLIMVYNDLTDAEKQDALDYMRNLALRRKVQKGFTAEDLLRIAEENDKAVAKGEYITLDEFLAEMREWSNVPA